MEPDGEAFAAYRLGDLHLVRGEGVRVWDRDSTEYLDCVSGTFNLILGHNHPEVIATIKKESDGLIFASSMFQTTATNRLMEALVKISPTNLTRVNLRSSGGSTANEGAIKIAQLHTGRQGVIVPFRSHLGQTLAMAEYSGFSHHRRSFPALAAKALNVPDPYCKRCFYRQNPETCAFLCIDRIDDFLEYAGAGTAACIILEPISGVGGNIVPPAGYLSRLKSFCQERGIVLIFDENQTSLGRTGHMFAADAFDVQPNIMTVSKCLTGSGLPLAAILMEEDLAILERPLHGFTFGGGNLAAAVAVTTLAVIQRPDFLENVRKVGAHLLGRLEGLERGIPGIFDVRGMGLMLGLELADAEGKRSPHLARAAQRSLLQNGIITRVSEHGQGNVIELRPPLILTHEEADLIADRFEVSLRAVAAT